MSENKQIPAKDLCHWERGIEKCDIAILSALNRIIEGLADLQCNNWKYIVDVTYLRCDNIYNSDELMEMMERFEIIRALLFGDKINYTKLLEMLQDNVDECGYTEGKAQQKREENKKKMTPEKGYENSEVKDEPV